MKRIITTLALAATMVLASASVALAHDPTCAELLGIDNHSEHVISDYVVGEDGVGPAGGADAPGGVEIEGGPGPGFHFGEGDGIAPGASFCTDANSGVIYNNPAENGRPQTTEN